MAEKLFPRPSIDDRAATGRRTQSERTALSDALMFEAAIRLVAERGTHALTLKDVGEAAGYSRGLASTRFGSKNDLFNELILAASERWMGVLKDRIGAARGLAALDIYTSYCFDLMVSEWHELKSLHQLCFEAIGGDTPTKHSVAANQAWARKRVEQWIEEGRADGEVRTDISSASLALCYTSLFLGLVFQILADPDSIDARRGLAELRASFWTLMGAEQPQAQGTGVVARRRRLRVTEGRRLKRRARSVEGVGGTDPL